MTVIVNEYDGVYVIANNHYLRDYHRSAEQQQQTAVISGNPTPLAVAGPEVHQALHPMATPALQQQHHQQRLDGGGADFVAVSSRKYRYLCDE